MFSDNNVKMFPPDAEFELDKGEDSSFADSFNPDSGGFRPVKIRQGDFGEFATNSFVEDEGGFVQAEGDAAPGEGEMPAPAPGSAPPTITAERDMNTDPCLTLDPTKMSKKQWKQMNKRCKQKGRLFRQSAKTENVRARADVKRGRAHKIASIGEMKKAKGESMKQNAAANQELNKTLGQMSQQEAAADALGAQSGKQLISGVPNGVVYGGIAVLGLITVIGVGFAIKSSMGAKAAASSAAPAK